MDGALSPEEVERYRTDGFFLLRRPVFRPQQFAALSRVMEEHLAGAFGDFDRSDQLDVPHFRDPRLLDFLLSDEALALAMAALGTDNVGVWRHTSSPRKRVSSHEPPIIASLLPGPRPFSSTIVFAHRLRPADPVPRRFGVLVAARQGAGDERGAGAHRDPVGRDRQQPSGERLHARAARVPRERRGRLL